MTVTITPVEGTAAQGLFVCTIGRGRVVVREGRYGSRGRGRPVGSGTAVAAGGSGEAARAGRA